MNREMERRGELNTRVEPNENEYAYSKSPSMNNTRIDGTATMSSHDVVSLARQSIVKPTYTAGDFSWHKSSQRDVFETWR